MPDTKPDLEQIATSVSLRTDWGRWFLDNHDEFERALVRRSPKWEPLLEKLAEEAGAGKLPEAWDSPDEIVRKKARVRFVRATKKIWGRAHARVLALRSQAAPVAAVRPAPESRPTEAVGSDAEPMRRKFEPVRPK